MKTETKPVIHIAKADTATHNLINHAYEIMREEAGGRFIKQDEFMKTLATEYLTLKTLGKYWVRR